MRTKLLTMFTVLLALFSTSLKAQETTYYWYVGNDEEIAFGDIYKLADNVMSNSETIEENIDWTKAQQVTSFESLGYSSTGTKITMERSGENHILILCPKSWSDKWQFWNVDNTIDLTTGFTEVEEILETTFVKDGIEYDLWMAEGYAGNIAHIRATAETAYYWYVGWTLPTSLEELKTLAVESESSHGGSITEISSEKLLTNSSEIRNSSNAHYYVVIPVGYDIYDATLPNTPITNNSFTEVTDIVIANHEIYKSNDGARSNSGLEIYEATKYYWYVGTSIPAELNGAVSNPETDKWVEIGTEIPSYIKVTTASDYSFPTWYVVMPTSFQFRPHDGGGIDDESSIWEISFSSIDGYTLYTVKDETSEIQSVFKKRGSLPYNADADYWYLGVTDPTLKGEIAPISVKNVFSGSSSWEEIMDPSAKIEINKMILDYLDWDWSMVAWYIAMPASRGYTPQDADFWETSTATIAGKDYIVYAYKEDNEDWENIELNTYFLPEGYVEENPEPEPTPAPASVAFTFTRGADVAVNVEGIEGVTASIEAAPAAYLTTAAAANDSILCINQNTSTATADNPNKYTLTITNNSGVDLAFDYINVCGVALTSAGNFQGLSTVRDRVFVVSYGDNTLAPATMRICDDNHCSGVATVNTFEAVDAIPAGSTYVIGVSIYTDGGAGCFYGLTRITLGKNEPEGGDVTNIESPVLEAQGSQLIYDLTGRRVTHPTKGIYIVNGKKMLF